MTLRDILDLIHRAKTRQGVASAIGISRQHLKERDPIALFIIKIEAEYRMNQIISSRIKTAKDIRQERTYAEHL